VHGIAGQGNMKEYLGKDIPKLGFGLMCLPKLGIGKVNVNVDKTIIQSTFFFYHPM
jgi:hypothetical protein